MARWSTVSWLVVGLMATGPTTAFAQSAASGDFRGMVAVAEGKIHLECAGVGGPAVILISGYRNNAEVWTVEPGPELEPVFAGVAGFTRVCAYDRPGTILAADHLSRSDPVAMPRTADAVVAELHDLLQTSRIPGPHVLAAHSLGGLFARLYAATYPGDVAGIVLVDAWQEDLPEILGPDGWSAYVDVAGPPPPDSHSIPSSNRSTSVPPRKHCTRRRRRPPCRPCRSSSSRGQDRCSFRPTFPPNFRRKHSKRHGGRARPASPPSSPTRNT